MPPGAIPESAAENHREGDQEYEGASSKLSRGAHKDRVSGAARTCAVYVSDCEYPQSYIRDANQDAGV